MQNITIVKTRRIIALLALISFFSCSFSYGENPPGITGNYNLFKIDRSRDPDVIIYDVNLDDRGNLNRSNPISIYWKKYSKEGEHESLTGIQRKFGYGLTFRTISENKVTFQFVSYHGLTFELRKSNDNNYKVYTIVEGKSVEVKSLYIHFTDNSFWFPKIDRIELYGIDKDRGSLIAETFYP